MSTASGRGGCAGLAAGQLCGGGARPHCDLVQAELVELLAHVGGLEEHRPRRDRLGLQAQAGVEAALEQHVEDHAPLLVVAVQDAVRLRVGRVQGQAPGERLVVEDGARECACGEGGWGWEEGLQHRLASTRPLGRHCYPHTLPYLTYLYLSSPSFVPPLLPPRPFPLPPPPSLLHPPPSLNVDRASGSIFP